jgi:hypothetical protein
MRPTWRQPAVLGFQGGGGKGGKALHQHWLASNLRSQHADTQDRRIDTLPPSPYPPPPTPGRLTWVSRWPLTRATSRRILGRFLSEAVSGSSRATYAINATSLGRRG